MLNARNSEMVPWFAGFAVTRTWYQPIGRGDL